MKTKLLIGFSEKNITPDRPVCLAGQFHTRISTHVETPVMVNVMAVESVDEQMIICSCDLLSISAALVRLVRAKVAVKNQEIDLNKIVISATHTHSSLAYDAPEDLTRPSPSAYVYANTIMPKGKKFIDTVEIGPEVLLGRECTEFLAEIISDAICDAWKNREPALCSPGFGRAPIGYCRRVIRNQGVHRLGYEIKEENIFREVESGSDSGIEMIFICDSSATPLGVVASVACPSQIVENKYFISSDFWGKARNFLKEHFGADFHIIGLCSAAGDQSPRDTVRYGRGVEPSMTDIEGTVAVGKSLSDAIINAYERAKNTLVDEVQLIHKSEIFDMPINKVSETEYEEAKKQLYAYVQEANKDIFDYKDMVRIHPEVGKVFLYDWLKNVERLPAEIHVIRFGDMAIATNPFELFLDYGNQLKARSKSRQTMLIQLACDCMSYLPTAKAEPSGGYGTSVVSCYCGHEGGEFLVEKTLAIINSLWD